MNKQIGVVTNDPTNVFQRQVITGIRTIAVPKGYAVQVYTQHPTDPQLEALDGVLVIANVLPDDALRDLYASGKPLSLVSHRVRYTTIPAVIPDNTGGINALVDYLVGRGKTRIAFIEGDMNQNDGIERSIAFRKQLMRHNLPIDERLFLRGDFDVPVAEASMRHFLSQNIPFDAVAGSDYLLAIAALRVMHQMGQGDGVCVVGFGDGTEAAEAGLTTVGVDVEQIGMRAARQLFGQLEGLRLCGVTLLGTTIVERDSC